MWARWTFLALLIGTSLLPWSISAQGNQEVVINVSVTGDRVMVKLDDSTCAFGFYGMSQAPELVVLGDDNTLLSSVPMGEGNWSLRSGRAYCDQSYTVSLPDSGSFTIQIAPYFTQDYTANDTVDGQIDIEITRKEGDPLPLPVGPQAGAIEGTGQYRVIGTFELYGESFEDFISVPAFGCTGFGGYQDIAVGAQITIKNQSGDIIAVTALQPPLDLEGEFGTDRCVFEFVAEVPEATFYTFTLGRRGDITYSFAELEASGWRLSLSIGR